MRSRARLLLICGTLLSLLGAGAGPGQAEAPARVVSINLCTDQLAMLVAGPEQLVSVSFVALDPHVSAMTKEAEAYPINYGLAEEIYLMRPDLVVAGTYAARASVNMLRRLGIPVVEFEATYSLDDVRDRILQMGEVLHREETARAMVADFDKRLAAFSAEVQSNPRAVLYHANGFTSGDTTLAGQILLAAGFANAVNETRFAAGGKLPLEVLAMTDPDAVITAQPYPGASRSEQILDHPIVAALRDGRGTGVLTDSDWVCGTPYVLRAIDDLADARRELNGDSK